MRPLTIQLNSCFHGFKGQWLELELLEISYQHFPPVSHNVVEQALLGGGGREDCYSSVTIGVVHLMTFIFLACPKWLEFDFPGWPTMTVTEYFTSCRKAGCKFSKWPDGSLVHKNKNGKSYLQANASYMFRNFAHARDCPWIISFDPHSNILGSYNSPHFVDGKTDSEKL